jgi:hypothetical protein
VLNWNGSARPTTFVSSSKLTAAIYAVDIASPGTAWVTVANPSPGGGTSNGAFLPISSPKASITLRPFYYGVGLAPFSVTAADFNSDGHLDVVAANYLDSTISLLLGNGDGTLGTATNYPTGMSPRSLATGDFNGDGRLDLVTANENSATVSVFLSNGDGTFQLGVAYPAVPRPTSVTASDFNADGKLDLAVTNAELGSGWAVAIMLGNGDGTFQSAGALYSVGTNPVFAAAGDFDRDGKIDLAVANRGGSVSVLAGNGDGTLGANREIPVGVSPSWVTVADFNLDGKLDLAVSNTGSSSISVLLGNGDGIFQAQVEYATFPGPFSGTVGDFNSDGKLDLAVPAGGGSGDIPGAGLSLSMLPGNGDGTFQTAVDFTTGKGPIAASAGDFNGDGRLDIVVADYQAHGVSVLLHGPAVTLSGTSLNFGYCLVGVAGTIHTPKVTNTGSAMLNVGAITLTGDHASDFAQTNDCGPGVPAGEYCTITITFKPNATGDRTATLSISHDAEGSPHTLLLTGNGTDFSIKAAADSATTGRINAGQTANYRLLVVSEGGFLGSVSLKCSGVRDLMDCDIHPSSVAVNGIDPAPFTVEVTTYARDYETTRLIGLPPNLPRGLLAAFGLTALAAFVSARQFARHGARWILAATFLVLLSSLACGGGWISNNYGYGTSPGTYYLTVTATSGGVSHTLPLTLEVN